MKLAKKIITLVFSLIIFALLLCVLLLPIYDYLPEGQSNLNLQEFFIMNSNVFTGFELFLILIIVFGAIPVLFLTKNKIIKYSAGLILLAIGAYFLYFCLDLVIYKIPNLNYNAHPGDPNYSSYLVREGLVLLFVTSGLLLAGGLVGIALPIAKEETK